MNYRRLGRSGLKVSELCLGPWINHGYRLDESATHAELDAALEVGINFIDTADVYANGISEEVIGRWLKRQDRRQIVLASKSWGRVWDGPNGKGSSRKHIMEAVEASLRRLQTDYIDLYQMHAMDLETPLEETMRALDDLVHQGKVLYIGCSNYDSERIGEAARLAEQHNLYKFISLQPGYNMFDREIEKDIPRCVQEGVGIIPYYPLAKGLLTNKYLGGEVPADSRANTNEPLRKRIDEKLPIMRKLAEFANARDIKLSQLALAWLLHQPAVVAPIIGASRPEQIHENAQASDVKLSVEELAEIESILKAE